MNNNRTYRYIVLQGVISRTSAKDKDNRVVEVSGACKQSMSQYIRCLVGCNYMV